MSKIRLVSNNNDNINKHKLHLKSNPGSIQTKRQLENPRTEVHKKRRPVKTPGEIHDEECEN